jgi:hypothetical protein
MKNTANRLRTILFALAAVFVVIAGAARAADRDRLEAFLQVTGFDVALDSIRLSAEAAPDMIGVDPGAFGSEWARLSGEVFDTALMHDMALDILAATLDDELLAHAAGFYATDLGQRLVAVENASHMHPDDDAKLREGRALVADMVEAGDDRIETIKRMNAAVDSAGTGARALQEVQYRFLLAASAAGIVELRMSPDDLRAVMAAREGEVRMAIQRSALSGAAYTYQTISDADLVAYAEALEHPDMQRVYELMNAVQFEIMANRFEVLAGRMAGLTMGEDI